MLTVLTQTQYQHNIETTNHEPSQTSHKPNHASGGVIQRGVRLAQLKARQATHRGSQDKDPTINF